VRNMKLYCRPVSCDGLDARILSEMMAALAATRRQVPRGQLVCNCPDPPTNLQRRGSPTRQVADASDSRFIAERLAA
jgi:hypothetical protein